MSRSFYKIVKRWTANKVEKFNPTLHLVKAYIYIRLASLIILAKEVFLSGIPIYTLLEYGRKY